MVSKKINILSLFGFTYFISGVYIIKSGTDFSNILFTKLIVSISVSTFFYSLSDFIIIFKSFSILKAINSSDFNDNKSLINLIDYTFDSDSAKKNKLDIIITSFCDFIKIIAFFSSIFLLFFNYDFKDSTTGLIAIASFSMYMLKLGLEEDKNLTLKFLIFLNKNKASLDLIAESVNEIKNSLPDGNSFQKKDTTNVSQSHRKAIRRRYRTRSPHPRQLR